MELVVYYKPDFLHADFFAHFPDVVGGDDGGVFKYEVLAREENYNQAAVETCFDPRGRLME